MQALTLTEKIIKKHVNGPMNPGEEVYLKIDYTLTQDATGTMAYLELLSMDIDHVKTQKSVSYVDHNTLQNGFENADDHVFLQSVANKYGISFSRPGNGICHQVQLERFSKPGITLLGSDSHTPTSGGLGALAIGAGGLDVALAMAGKPFKMVMPKVCGVHLTGALQNGVTAKDIILEVLRIKTVKGGLNTVFEYFGEGVQTLTVPERATICNMGAELGATTSIFPSDEQTKLFLKREGREQDYTPLAADIGCTYSEILEIDLSSLCAKAACPYMPDVVKDVSELKGMKVDQVLIGSCTNSSYEDMIKVASILKGKTIAKNVSFGVNPGSRQVLAMMAESGILLDLIQAGARILECTCGACIGMGQSPATNAVSLRTYNRNFYGRSGTNSASVYLVSPVVAAMSALSGVFEDPTGTHINLQQYEVPDHYMVDDSMIIEPQMNGEIVMGPNIMPLPHFDPLPEVLTAPVVLKVGDDITTDHIMPAGAKILPYRSNIEKLSDFCYSNVDANFKTRCKANGQNIIVGGFNYGQGSSREHAAIAPRYLGVRAILACSFARIHRQNLMNFGIAPLIISEELYKSISQDDVLTLSFKDFLIGKVYLTHNGKEYVLEASFTEEEREMILRGALLNCL